MRAVTRLIGWALTPVHVGDGTTMTPETYRLRRQGNADVLERFDVAAVIAAMPEAAMRGYVSALRQGGLSQAQTMLQKAADGRIVERVMVSAASRREIETLVANPQRTGRVSPFVRSGGLAILPGSSLKGAMRTAWLAAMTTDAIGREIGAEAERERVGRTGALSNRLQEMAFEYVGQHTEQDPMRDLSLGDVVAGDAATMIDKVQVLNRSKDGPVTAGPEGNMQIHVERLLSLADPEHPAPRLALDLSLATPTHVAARRGFAGSRADGRDRALPRNTPSIEALRISVNRHHAHLWRLERDVFYAGTGTDSLLDALLVAWDLPANDGDALATALDARGAWLLRVGRYGHFEAKTVEGLRYGEKRGKNGRDGQRREASFMREAGGSRTAARDASGLFLPFGWMLFLPADIAPQTPPRPAFTRVGAGATAPEASFPAQRENTAAQLRITTQLRFRKGDRVTNGDGVGVVISDVPIHAKRMDVDFDGEVEEASVEGFRKA